MAEKLVPAIPSTAFACLITSRSSLVRVPLNIAGCSVLFVIYSSLRESAPEELNQVSELRIASEHEQNGDSDPPTRLLCALHFFHSTSSRQRIREATPPKKPPTALS